jgi:hypothetical protein
MPIGSLLIIVRVYMAVLVVVMFADLLGLINNGQSSLERSQFILVILLLGLLGIIGLQGINFLRKREGHRSVNQGSKDALYD